MVGDLQSGSTLGHLVARLGEVGVDVDMASSGAMYNGVPTATVMCCFFFCHSVDCCNCLATPKSHNLACPFLSTKMLSGFRSR